LPSIGELGVLPVPTTDSLPEVYTVNALSPQLTADYWGSYLAVGEWPFMPDSVFLRLFMMDTFFKVNSQKSSKPDKNPARRLKTCPKRRAKRHSRRRDKLVKIPVTSLAVASSLLRSVRIPKHAELRLIVSFL